MKKSILTLAVLISLTVSLGNQAQAAPAMCTVDGTTLTVSNYETGDASCDLSSTQGMDTLDFTGKFASLQEFLTDYQAQLDTLFAADPEFILHINISSSDDAVGDDQNQVACADEDCFSYEYSADLGDNDFYDLFDDLGYEPQINLHLLGDEGKPLYEIDASNPYSHENIITLTYQNLTLVGGDAPGDYRLFMVDDDFIPTPGMTLDNVSVWVNEEDFYLFINQINLEMQYFDGADEQIHLIDEILPATYWATVDFRQYFPSVADTNMPITAISYKYPQKTFSLVSGGIQHSDGTWQIISEEGQIFYSILALNFDQAGHLTTMTPTTRFQQDVVEQGGEDPSSVIYEHYEFMSAELNFQDLTYQDPLGLTPIESVSQNTEGITEGWGGSVNIQFRADGDAQTELSALREILEYAYFDGVQINASSSNFTATTVNNGYEDENGDWQSVDEASFVVQAPQAASAALAYNLFDNDEEHEDISALTVIIATEKPDENITITKTDAGASMEIGTAAIDLATLAEVIGSIEGSVNVDISDNTVLAPFTLSKNNAGEVLIGYGGEEQSVTDFLTQSQLDTDSNLSKEDAAALYHFLGESMTIAGTDPQTGDKYAFISTDADGDLTEILQDLPISPDVIQIITDNIEPDWYGYVNGKDFIAAIVAGKISSITFSASATREDVEAAIKGTTGQFTVTFGGVTMLVKDAVLYEIHTVSVQTAPNQPGLSAPQSRNVPNNARPQGCDASIPVGQPDLFQIDRQADKAVLYFTPVRDNTDRYHVIFGYREGDERFSGVALQVDSSANNGVIALDISNLDSKQAYSFKVAPVHDCAVGQWSNWLTASANGAHTGHTYRYAEHKSTGTVYQPSSQKVSQSTSTPDDSSTRVLQTVSAQYTGSVNRKHKN